MPKSDGIPAERSGTPAPGCAENALLSDLVRWREELARSIARNNLSFRSGQIMTAVNRILFPLLLLAVAENRRLSSAGMLANLRDCPDEQNLSAVLGPFADELYAGAFPDTPVTTGPAGNPVLDELVIRRILADIAAPRKHYDLRLMPAASLGQILTSYLSRTIRRSAAHHAGSVDTHDTVLSGGATVPPLALIESLADKALGDARRSRSDNEILPLRVLDPACGSGSVLAAAYRNLIRTTTEPALSREERREILVQSIHGVDISPHAVAATRMLLVLQLLETDHNDVEREDFFTQILPVFRDLQRSILCGNALVGPEISQDESWNFCPLRNRHTLNLFSWTDHFTEVRVAGGFDVVLCNPPDGAVEPHEWIQQYFQRHFTSFQRAADRSAYFVEISLSLLRYSGTLAFVMRSRWLRGTGGSPLRVLLKDRRIIGIGEFPGPGLCSIMVRNARPAGSFTVVRSDIPDIRDGTGRIVIRERFPVDPAGLDEGGWVFCDTRTERILAKVEACGTRVADFCRGGTGCGALKRTDDRLLLSRAERDRLVKMDRRSNDLLRPYAEGRYIGRYQSTGSGKYYLLIPRVETAGAADGKTVWRRIQKEYPALARYLKARDPAIAGTPDGRRPWYETGCRDEFSTRSQPKILFPCRSTVPAFTFDGGRSVVDRNAGYLVTANHFLLAVLNSRLARFWFQHRQLPVDADGLQDTVAAAAGFFIHVPDLDNPGEAGRQYRIEQLARKMLVYHEQCARGSDKPECGQFRKKIERTDRQIDSLVYALYGLTAEEIAIVESDEVSLTAFVPDAV